MCYSYADVPVEEQDDESVSEMSFLSRCASIFAKWYLALANRFSLSSVRSLMPCYKTKKSNSESFALVRRSWHLEL